MNIHLRNFLICALIFITMKILFEWGYGEISTFPQWLVYSVSYIGTCIGACLDTDIFSGRN
ncbi:hypothetical protein [Pediococcus pentosaceus]|uniref:hypothetical protein n=1 Tax=Pediococcus pentosaceus TaxID=1255 RepID=UPI0015A0325C|nr:hypothetical protein [Pediococcus pentosaceus]MBF7102283.1 hypothetical protein [Pediococcus pentosaceus]